MEGEEMDGGASRGPHCLAIGLLYMYVHVHTCIYVRVRT